MLGLMKFLRDIDEFLRLRKACTSPKFISMNIGISKSLLPCLSKPILSKKFDYLVQSPFLLGVLLSRWSPNQHFGFNTGLWVHGRAV
jgi:hypothetical protein